MAVATSGWRVPDDGRLPNAACALRPRVRIIVRAAVSAMVPLLTCCGSGGHLTSGDECNARRSTSTLGTAEAQVVMPAYRMPGLPEDEPSVLGVLPWVEIGH